MSERKIAAEKQGNCHENTKIKTAGDRNAEKRKRNFGDTGAAV